MIRLKHILMIILLAVASWASGQNYVIDSVCVGADREYRIDGEEGSIWIWNLEDSDGNEISNPTGNDFSDTDIDGNPVIGSEINILWNVVPGIYSISVEQTSKFGCTNHELGDVEVAPLPEVPVLAVTQPACEIQTGTLEVTSPVGAEYTYSINGTDFQVKTLFENLGPDNYTVTVQNTDNCKSSANETINAVTDTVPPVVNCVEPFTIQLDANAQYSLTVNEVHLNSSDECGIDTVYLSIYKLDCNNIGINPITVYAVDNNGNIDSCTTEITVYGNIAPIVVNDSAITAFNTSVSVNVVANDYDMQFDLKTDIDVTTLNVRLNPVHGIVEKVRVNGKLNGFMTYTPAAGFIGVDTLTYSICDDAIPCVPMCGEALVFITVLAENNPPLAVDDSFDVYCSDLTGSLTDNDSDPDLNEIQINTTPVKLPLYGEVTIAADGSFTYVPDKNFTGVDSFVYQICDNGLPGLCDTATVYITKYPDNDCDGVSDMDDIDDDNDGILDVVEGLIDMDGDGLSDNGDEIDTDQDRIPDYLDIDSDDDGIVDNIEGQEEGKYIPPTGIDSNNDGWDDVYDPNYGGYYFDPVDTDGDSMPDYLDLDSDNDHVFDFIEGHDIDANGIPDVTRIFTDSDGDGLDDIYDTVDGWNNPFNAIGSNAPLQDFDQDGTRDWRDTNDEDDEFMTKDEDLNNDGDYSNDDLDLDGYPEYLDKTLDCELFIPEGFSPNDDGVHDYFQILCIQKYPNARLMIFNRNGDKLFDKEHYGNLDVWGTNANAWWWGTSEHKWTIGRIGGLPAGNYMYVVELGNGKVKNGTVMVSY